jgi:hypothetical protein
LCDGPTCHDLRTSKIHHPPGLAVEMSTHTSRSGWDWPIFASLLMAGWLGAVVASSLAGALMPVGSGLRFGSGFFLLSSALADMIAALFLPSILRAIADLDVSLGKAFVALLGGSLATNVFLIVLQGSTAQPGVFTPSFGLFGLLSGLIGSGVSYLVLQTIVARSQLRKPTFRRSPQTHVAEATGVVDYEVALAGARTAISDVCNLLSRCSPDDWPLRSLDALSALQVAADRLRRTGPNDPGKRVAHDGLIEALRDLQDSIVQTGRYDLHDPSAILHDPALERAESCLSKLATM